MADEQTISSPAPAAPPVPPGAAAPAPAPQQAAPAPAPAPAAPAAPPVFDPKAVGPQMWDAMDEDLRGWYETRGVDRDRFDPLEVAKQRREVQQMISKKGMILPTDEADEAGWNGVYQALGVPKDPSGYGIQTDDPAIKDQADAVAKLYHDAKLTPMQAKKMAEGSAALYEQQQQTAAANAAADKEKREETIRRETAELQREWGTKWDQNDESAGRAIKALGLDEAALHAITEKAGYKKMMQALAAIGGAAGESTFHGAFGTQPAPGISSAAGARAKIAELMTDRAFQARMNSTDRNVHSAALKEWEALNKLAHGT